jgi:hypothetical protein
MENTNEYYLKKSGEAQSDFDKEIKKYISNANNKCSGDNAKNLLENLNRFRDQYLYYSDLYNQLWK